MSPLPLGIIAGSRRRAGGGGTPTLVQTASGATSTSTSTSVTATAATPTAPDSLVLAFLAFRGTRSTPPTVAGLTLIDWSDGSPASSTGTPGIAVFSGAGGGSSYTASWASGSSAALVISEYADASVSAHDLARIGGVASSASTIPGAQHLAAALATTDTDATGPDLITDALSSGSVNVRICLALQDVAGASATWTHGTGNQALAAVSLS